MNQMTYLIRTNMQRKAVFSNEGNVSLDYIKLVVFLFELCTRVAVRSDRIYQSDSVGMDSFPVGKGRVSLYE